MNKINQMNKIKYLIFLILLSSRSFAEYSVFFPLDGNKIVIKDNQVNGEIKLKDTVINRGNETSIIWDYKYANKIEIENIGSYSSKKGSASVSPYETTEYFINVSNGGNNKIERLTLTVIQPEQEINFISDLKKIGVGQSTKLNWDVINAESASIDNGIGNVSLNDNITVSPEKNTTYTLTAKGYTGIHDKSRSLFIEVVPNSVISSFIVDKDKVTIGDTVNFNWNVENSELLTFNGEKINNPISSKSLVTKTTGNFDYTLESTSFSGIKINETKTVNVYPEPIINSFTVNGIQNSIKVAPNTNLVFSWSATGTEEQTLDGIKVNSQTETLTSLSNGTKDYTYINKNGAGKSVQEKITVDVIQPATAPSITAPSAVFANTPFTLSFTASGAKKYKIKSNNTSSGVPTNNVDLDSSTITITPTTAGTFNYTVTAINDIDTETSSTKTVIVENDPTFTTFTVNGLLNASAVQSSLISFNSSGFSNGSFLNGTNNDGTVETELPTNAPATIGTYTYYANAKKVLNGVTRYSQVKSVNLTVTSAKTCPAWSTSNTVRALVYDGGPTYQYWKYNGVNIATTNAVSSVTTGGYKYTRSTLLYTSAYDDIGSTEIYYRICRE